MSTTSRLALLLGLLVLPAICASPASAQTVGVTSATAGGPLGKPPTEVERVLRVGVDVKANELITTGAADRAHLVFLDGTALTVGPSAQLTIDRFVYDADKKLGELAVNATRGVFRVVGGRISKTTPIVVRTPSSTLTIRGSIMVFKVEAGSTGSAFLHGIEMTVTAQGKTQSVKAPGWQVVTVAGRPPGSPAQVPPGGLIFEMSQLEGGTGGASNVTDIDKLVRDSGFSGQNSEKTFSVKQPGAMGGPDNDVTKALNDAITQKGFGKPTTSTSPGPNNYP